MGIKFGPGSVIAGFQHAGGGGGGGGSFVSPTTAATDPFGGAGPSWSFNGANNGLVVSVDTNGLNPGANDWCFEGYFYQTDNNPFPRIFSIGSYPTASIAISLEGGTAYYWLNSGIAGTVTKPSTNTWHHFAFSYNATQGQTTLYMDGVPHTVTNTNIPSISGASLIIGAESVAALPNSAFGGYMNSLRWTVGNSVYTGIFTVPTAALQTTQSSDTNINAITSGQVKLLM